MYIIILNIFPRYLNWLTKVCAALSKSSILSPVINRFAIIVRPPNGPRVLNFGGVDPTPYV